MTKTSRATGPAEASFDKAAAAYDRFMGRWSRLYIPELIEAIDLQPGERVLDVAAGTGEATLASADRVRPQGTVVASDVSIPMLHMAGAKAGSKRILLVATQGHALACRAGTFDAVTCALGLMLFPDPLAGLREFYRVLRPGGRVATSVWSTADHVPLLTVMLESLARYLPDEREAIEKVLSLSDPDQLAVLFEQAGFADRSVRRESRRLVFESFDDYWSPFEAGGSRASAPYQALPLEAQADIRAEVRRRLAAFESGGRFILDVEMLFATGRREESAR